MARFKSCTLVRKLQVRRPLRSRISFYRLPPCFGGRGGSSMNNSNDALVAAEEHRVVLDRVGPEGRTRYCCATCMETKLIGSIVVEEPFMTSGVWQRRLV